ncbi:hypothetical protein D3C76_1599430 [compost metagenome]
MFGKHLGHGLGNHAARNGINRSFADRNRQAGFGHTTYPDAAIQLHTRLLPPGYMCDDLRQMRSIRIIPGIFDGGTGSRAVRHQFLLDQFERVVKARGQ